MTLVWNWKVILLKAQSVWLLYFLILSSAAEAGLPYVVDGFMLPPGTSAALTATVSAMAIWARVTYQPSVVAPPATDADATKLVTQMPMTQATVIVQGTPTVVVDPNAV